MAFKIKDGVRVGLTDVFNSAGNLLVDAPRVASRDGSTYVAATTSNSSGADDETLRFGTGGVERFTLTTNSATLASSISVLNVNATTASTDTTTGALVVTGGVGIGGALNVGGSATFSSIQNTPIGSVTRSTGAFTQVDADNLRLDGNTLSSTNTDGNILLNPDGDGYVQVVGTNGLVIPVGNNSQQGPAVQGAIRYNSEISQFEGYSGTNWSSLGGVRSVDGLTYITAESTPGASNDTLTFVTDGTTAMSLDTNSLDIASKIATVNIDATTQSTNTTTGALVVDGGVGIAKDLNIGGNTTVGGSLTVIGSVNMGSATFTSINNTPIGTLTPNTGNFTTLESDSFVVTDATDATSKDTGALIVTNGGLGVELKIHAGGNITTDSDLDVKGGTISQNGTAAIEMTGANVEVKGDLTVGGNDIKAADGATALTLSNTSGDVAVAGDLTVTGNDIKSSTATAITLSGADATVQGDLTVNGNDIKSSTATAITLSGSDVEVKGDLTVTGNDIFSSTAKAVTLSGADVNVLGSLDVDINLNVDGTAQIDGNTTIGVDKFKVLAASGNTEIAGTMALAGTLTINTDKFQVMSANGNTSIAGTLIVQGASTFNNTVSLSGFNITNLADPVNPQDAATKYYVDSARAGLDVKESVKAATTANITLSGAQIIDGVSVVSGDRVLVKNQTIATQNGIYVAAAGAWARSDDANNTPAGEVTNGMFTFVEQGTVNGKAGFVLVTVDPITLGTTNLEFALFSVSGTIVAGNGLSKTGDTLEVNVASNGGIEINSDNLRLKSTVAGAGLTWDDSTSGIINVVGTADRITVNADSVDIASTYVGQSSITTLGTIGTGTWQGTIVSPTYGGTGINNGSSTITLNGGNLVLSGGDNLTFNTTDTTSVTLPTTGTLATLSNSETISNKTITNSSIGSSNPSTAAFTTLTASGATTLTANTSSSNTTTGTLVVTGGVGISENLNVGGDLKVIGNVLNTTVGGTTISADEVIQLTVSTTTETTMDSFSGSTYRSARYLIQISQGTDYQVSEFRVIHNGTNAYFTEYSVLETNGPLATFTAVYSGGNVLLKTTMASATSATINIIRTAVVV